MRKGAITALVCAILLLMPITMFSYNADGITSNLFVSQSIKNINGKTTQQVNAGQQAMISIDILNYAETEQPFTAIIDVRDESDVSVHIELTSGTLGPSSRFDIDFPWTAEESGAYKVRTFIITSFESPEIMSRVSSSTLEVTNSDTLKNSLASGNLAGISKFSISSDKGQNTVWFTLLDENGKQAAYDGEIKLTITDSIGALRYTDILQVTTDDFILFKPDETSAANIAYVWKFSMLDVKPSLGSGTAVLTFTASDSKIYSTTFGPVELYQASGNTLALEYDEMYNKNARDISNTIVKGTFKVTVSKVGHFTHLANSTVGEVTYYRADITIENVGNAVNSWPSQYLIIDDKSNQYHEIGGTLRAGDAIPGYDKTRGYILFHDVTETASWINLIIRGSPDDPDELFEFHIDL